MSFYLGKILPGAVSSFLNLDRIFSERAGQLLLRPSWRIPVPLYFFLVSYIPFLFSFWVGGLLCFTSSSTFLKNAAWKICILENYISKNISIIMSHFTDSFSGYKTLVKNEFPPEFWRCHTFIF